MYSTGKKMNITRLKFSNHWRGIAFGLWHSADFDPEKLFAEYEKTFKSDSKVIVVLKTLRLSGRDIKVVIKRQARSLGIRDFFRSLMPGKAMRNCKMAMRLNENGVPAAKSIAAMQRKILFWTVESIYITEYIENSMSLYDIFFGKDPYALKYWPRVKKQIVFETATLLADLHNAGFWHRDSKAGNVLAYRNQSGDYKVKLIDLDGVKRYGILRRRRTLQTLWKLSETLSRFCLVSETDFWRGFRTYCQRTGVKETKMRPLFYELKSLTVSKRLLTIASDAYKEI